MTDVELFSGAGAASIGLAAAGINAIGFELDPVACATHQAAGHATVRADLATYPWPARLRGRVRYMHGSPPCQPFSTAGDGAGEDDERDGMPWMLRAVDELRPAVVTIENVPGLTHAPHRRYFGALLHELRCYGYDVEWRILNAADFGVPQCRYRLIIVARRDGESIRWPNITHTDGGGLFLEPWVSMADALGWGFDTPSRTVTGHRTPRWAYEGNETTGRTLVGFPRRDDGNGETVEVDGVAYRARDLFPVDRPSPVVTEKGRSWRLFTGTDWKPDGDREAAQSRDLDRPAPTISGKSGGQWQLRPGSWADGRGGNRRTYDVTGPAPAVALGNDSAGWCWERPATTVSGDVRVHPPGHKINGDDIAAGRTGHDRAGTNAIRVELHELAALQGFPPDYPFVGNRTSIARQIGNALPPALIAAVAAVNVPDAVRAAA